MRRACRAYTQRSRLACRRKRSGLDSTQEAALSSHASCRSLLEEKKNRASEKKGNKKVKPRAHTQLVAQQRIAPTELIPLTRDGAAATTLTLNRVVQCKLKLAHYETATVVGRDATAAQIGDTECR